MFELPNLIGAFFTGIIAFFLKRTMDELKQVQDQSTENRNQIEMLKVDYKNKIEHLTEKFDELKLTMSELIKEIKELNKRIK